MERFEEFLKERVYLIGVTQKTVAYYTWAFNAWKRHAPNGDPKEFVINLRQSGVSPISVNTYICAMNCYWKWSGEYNPTTKEGKHLAYLKEEQKILATLSADAVRMLITSKPRGINQIRAHLVALTILDTGLRASEALGLTKENVDFDSLTLKVLGKGMRYRLVPFSVELRKNVWRYMNCHKGILDAGRLMFGTKNNTKVSVRNLERDLKVLGQKLGITGIRFSPHTLRHTMAVNWLRRGGDIYSLSRVLGHSDIRTTTIYLRSLGIEDIQKQHQGLSLLSYNR